MTLATLEQRHILPLTLHEAWTFFSNPHNLKEITPPSMNFRVLSSPPAEMYAGMIIQYTVSPLFGIPLRWVTEISQVQKPHFFIDEQRFGPYAFWHHQHFFREVPDGVEMADIIHYALPLGWIGRVIHALAVRRKVEQIFDYRRHALEQRFSLRSQTELSCRYIS